MVFWGLTPPDRFCNALRHTGTPTNQQPSPVEAALPPRCLWAHRRYQWDRMHPLLRSGKRTPQSSAQRGLSLGGPRQHPPYPSLPPTPSYQNDNKKENMDTVLPLSSEPRCLLGGLHPLPRSKQARTELPRKGPRQSLVRPLFRAQAPPVTGAQAPPSLEQPAGRLRPGQEPRKSRIPRRTRLLL